MRLVIQRVSSASVRINNTLINAINDGLMILLGIEEADDITDINWLVKKICGLRIFNDENGIMNKSIIDVSGQILLVSQFTLYASTKKGNRPSYIKSAKPEIAIPLYNTFIKELESTITPLSLKTGEFGANMEVSLVNDGPVTIIIDSKIRE